MLGQWFKANPEKRSEIFLATKFAVQLAPGEMPPFKVDSSPEYCKRAIQKSLKRLGLEYIDLYYVHRLDKVTPIERTVQAMVELKNAGKIRYLGLSECSAETLRRAHAVHPITCVQVEYSPFCLAIETPQIHLMETARELGVGIVCYSPLGNGILTGAIRSLDDISKPGDSRGMLPWLKDDNIQHNVAVIDDISKVAESKGVTIAQLTLGWLLAQGDDIFPIPGTSKLNRLEENLGALEVSVSPEDDQKIRRLSTKIRGGRVQDLMGHTFADTPSL